MITNIMTKSFDFSLFFFFVKETTVTIILSYLNPFVE